MSPAGTARGRPLSALLSQGLGKDVKMKADTACLTLLQLRDPEHGKAGGSGHGGKTLLVANAHLHWDPRRPDIKAVQVSPSPKPCCLSPTLHPDPSPLDPRRPDIKAVQVARMCRRPRPSTTSSHHHCTCPHHHSSCPHSPQSSDCPRPRPSPRRCLAALILEASARMPGSDAVRCRRRCSERA